MEVHAGPAEDGGWLKSLYLALGYHVSVMSARRAAHLIKKLEADDIRVLLAVEEGTSRYQYVPEEEIQRATRIPGKVLSRRLSRLHGLGLLGRCVAPYVGYTPTTTGYDCLAIHALVRAEVLEALGRPLGVGKEADVYEALTPSGERVAVKFHRLGRTSFRQTRRLRGYTQPDVHATWFQRSKAAAGREFKALKLVHKHGVAVPRPIMRNRHVVVMGMIEGAELVEYSWLPNPAQTLHRILQNVRRAYLKAGVIHADLSEFNIVLEPNGEILIIDWPQFVRTTHPNAEQLLRRDLRNVLGFFRRKFRLSVDLEDAVDYVKGLREEPPP